ncbi:MAG: hypothetical protein JWN78_1015 [Bacteroidota bacterium]|nr:hypothetical protein [Bacteroidota bacterium]
MKILLLFNIFFFTLIVANALPPAGSDGYKEYMTWSPNRKLTWSDFQGKYIPNTSEAALTASSVEYSFSSRGSEFSWNVTAKYFPKLSWSRKSDQSSYILQHEQLHFDITELYARIFRKQLTENIKSVKDLSKIKGMGKQILSEWDKEEDQYDRESEHSINEIKQKEWILNIHQRLDKLKDFASK